MERRRTALQVIRDDHTTLAAMLASLLAMLQRGPGADPNRFFDVVRAMLFYIEEFPEKRHHPQESRLLFPMLARCAPELQPVIAELDQDHEQGLARVRELQHQLLAWELVGEGCRAAFEAAADAYVAGYLHHMRLEETKLLAVADHGLDAQQRAALDEAFQDNQDPWGPNAPRGVYDKLFSRIVMNAPAPIGVGPE